MGVEKLLKIQKLFYVLYRNSKKRAWSVLKCNQNTRHTTPHNTTPHNTTPRHTTPHHPEDAVVL
jgi:hypothetical protein